MRIDFMPSNAPSWFLLRGRRPEIELIYGTLITQVLVIVLLVNTADEAMGLSDIGNSMGGMLLVGAMPFFAIGLGASASLCLSVILGTILAFYLAFRYVPGPFLRFIVCALECGWLVFGGFVSSYFAI